MVISIPIRQLSGVENLNILSLRSNQMDESKKKFRWSENIVSFDVMTTVFASRTEF